MTNIVQFPVREDVATPQSFDAWREGECLVPRCERKVTRDGMCAVHVDARTEEYCPCRASDTYCKRCQAWADGELA